MLRPAQTPSRFHSRQEGFTILELMVVVAIVGVISALGVSNFGVWKSRADLKAAVTALQQELALARMTAMSRNLTVTATITVAPAVVTVTTSNTNTGAQLASSRHQITHVNGVLTPIAVGPAPQFTPTYAPAAGAAVTFNSMGFRVGGAVGASQNQLIAISNDRGIQYSMRITQRGAVTWCASQFCQGTH